MRGQVNEPMIHKVGGKVKLTKAIVLAPHQVIKAMGLTQMPALDKRLNVTTESAGHIQEGKIELSQVMRILNQVVKEWPWCYTIVLMIKLL